MVSGRRGRGESLGSLGRAGGRHGRPKLLGCYAPAVSKGLTSVSRTGSYREGAVNSTTRKVMSDGACRNQLRQENQGKSRLSVHNDYIVES